MKNGKLYSQMMTLMAEKYQKDFSELFQQALWNSLKPYTDQQCEKAFLHVFKHGEFFNKLLPDLMEQLEGTSQEALDRAWQKIIYALENYGNPCSVSFDDKAIHNCIEQLGGWQEINIKTWDELKWIRRDFDKLYPALKGQESVDHLKGDHELHNGEAQIHMIGSHKNEIKKLAEYTGSVSLQAQSNSSSTF